MEKLSTKSVEDLKKWLVENNIPEEVCEAFKGRSVTIGYNSSSTIG